MNPKNLDKQIGQRVRDRRRALGMSMQQVAAQLGIAYQQLQKYETGTNRIGAGRLWQIAKILTTPVATFFADCDQITEIAA